MKATMSMRGTPFSLNKAFKGAKNPLRISLMLRKYVPTTITRIPNTPIVLGNSPTIKGEVSNGSQRGGRALQVQYLR